MYIESCDEAHCLIHGKKRSMHRAGRVQNEQYTIFRSRLHHKLLPECRSCHAPIHRNEAICPWCGAQRTKPVTGVTQQLPRLPAPAPWYRSYDQLLPGVLLTLFQARLWLWLWPMPQYAVASHAADPRFTVFYYAMVFALAATVFYQCRWTLRLGVALIGLLACWIFRVFMA
jgi:hypothetical protein